MLVAALARVERMLWQEGRTRAASYFVSRLRRPQREIFLEPFAAFTNVRY